MLRAALIGLTLVSLTACTATGPRTPYGRFMEARANPGKVIATELAFARATRERGGLRAFAEYATDDAIMLEASGFTPFEQWLSRQMDSEMAVPWQAHEVLSSCDGSLAITRGSYTDPAGSSGSYITVWQRQADSEYRVTAYGKYPARDVPDDHASVNARTATCGEPPRLLEAPSPAQTRGGQSIDGTLTWGAFHMPGEQTSFVARIAENEDSVLAIDAVQKVGKQSK